VTSTEAVGVDVGATHVRVCRVRVHGRELSQEGPLVRRSWNPSGRATVDDLSVVLSDLVATLGAGPRAPIGVGFAGQLTDDGRVVINAPNLGWRDVALARALENALGRPRITVVNDMKAILAGEVSMGVARGADPVLACYVGTGVGGALAVGGAVVRGAGGNAGELGHVKLYGYDGACGCGERGCVEALCGGAAIVRRLDAERARGAWGSVFRDGEPSDVARVDEAALAGDPTALALWDELALGLGTALAGACTLLNPELVVLGGGVFLRAPGLSERVTQATLGLTASVARARLRFEYGDLGESAGALGAACVAVLKGPTR